MQLKQGDAHIPSMGGEGVGLENKPAYGFKK
jgi:hypothetical protein